MCEGRAKDKGAVPVRVPRKAEAGGTKWVGGEVIGEAVDAQPGREGRIRPSRAEKI
jgi:hypothetical protein